MEKKYSNSIGSDLGFSVAGLLFLMAYSYLEFLGWMYMTNGSSGFSILLTGILAIVLVVTSFLLPRVKSSNTAFTSKRRNLLTGITLAVFIVASFVSLVGVMHFFKVQKNEDIIQTHYSSVIKEAQSIYPKYDRYASARISTYEKLLNETVKLKKGKVEEYEELVGKFPGATDAIRVSTLVKSLRRTLQPSDNKFLEAFNSWLETVGNVNVWNISFVSNVNILDSRISTYIDQLKGLSHKFYHPGEKEEPFNYPEYVSSDEIKNFFNFEGFYYSNRMLFVWTITMFTLLMPWFRDIRSRKDI